MRFKMQINNLKKLLVFILVFVSLSDLFSQTVTVNGKDISRAGKDLIFYTWSDQITYQKDTIYHCKIKTDGDFSCSFNIKETIPITIPLENQSVFFYAEPDKVYRVKLPAIIEKNTGDKLNPYFEEKTIFLTLENPEKNELNQLIRKFEQNYNDYIAARFNEIYKSAKHSGVDTVIKMLDTSFVNTSNKYFTDYKKYKFGMLRFFAYIRNEKYLTKEYYRKQPILYYNVAYMNLFNQVYDNYFTYYAKTTEGSDVSMNISQQKSIRELKKTFAKNFAFDDDDFTELVILKGLHDEFYTGNFKRNVLLQTLDSFYLQTQNPIHKQIALNIKTKIAKQGKKISLNTLELFDKDSVKHTIEEYKGKYIYLGFCNAQNFACKEELELTKKLFEKKEKSLEIITVYIDETCKTIKDFSKKNNYKWSGFVTNQQSAIIKDLNIKAYPAYYLIGPDGRIVSAPAKTLKEGFEEYFMRTFGKKAE